MKRFIEGQTRTQVTLLGACGERDAEQMASSVPCSCSRHSRCSPIGNHPCVVAGTVLLLRGKNVATVVGIDPGLQAERTSLAWIRTLLSLLACSCLMFRWHTLGTLYIALLTGYLLHIAWVIGIFNRRRYTKAQCSLDMGKHRSELAWMLWVGLNTAFISGCCMIFMWNERLA